MNKIFSESEVIEKLNTARTVRGFFVAAVEAINDSVDALTQRVFRKDDIAQQTAVKPLLNEFGPLGTLKVRLKLLFGIGILPEDIYHDIEDIVEFKNRLNQDAQEYDFTDNKVINSLKSLRLINRAGVIPLELFENRAEEDTITQQRKLDIIKSGLSLAIVDICVQLNKYRSPKAL
ncbi:MltR family transcriptional regulator [Vibrio sp. JC009]|uniref:MltR family transcriptional regulator n=1 Tax=Vibrio sp. JC009 TaxID=2912314 RepID=UPI0023AED970|nr:MltR family transcriptional regulator [Vibrio sp. JC009]WED24832.1 MltR family transcriptional regulator [Vibrio sp. JC009]